MKILHIDSSVTGAQSVSRPLSKEAAAKLATTPGSTVTYRDLVDDPLNHYTAVLRIHGATPELHTPAQKAELAMGETILAEFLASDTIVIGAPMYNFSIPSQLKAWIDLIVVAGKTFSYGAGGAKGLCGDKKVIIISSRGGKYGEVSPMDFQEGYLKTILGFIGVTDITIIRAEGIGYGPEVAKTAIESAKAQIAKL